MAFAMFLSFFIAKGEDLDTAQSKETKHSGVNNVVTNKFKDNWFISLGLGGDVYMGQNDKAMPFGDRIGFTGHISGGKWDCTLVWCSDCYRRISFKRSLLFWQWSIYSGVDG